jgi:hypothetical protein
MEVKVYLYGEELNKKREAIGSNKPVKLEFMDTTDKLWREAEIMVFEGDTEGGEPAGLLGPFSEPYDEGKYFIKIMRILPSPLSDEE